MAVPVALDEDLIAEIDRVAGLKAETRSAIIRAAIRAGLAAVEGGGGDLVQLDRPLRTEIAAAAERLGKSVEEVLVESIRIGLGPYFVQSARSHTVEGKPVAVDDLETRLQLIFKATPEGGPSGFEHLQSLRTIRELREQLADLKHCIPEVNERLDAIAHLRALLRSKGTWAPYPTLLPLSEIQSQIAELEGEKPAPPAPAPAPSPNTPKPASKPKRK